MLNPITVYLGARLWICYFNSLKTICNYDEQKTKCLNKRTFFGKFGSKFSTFN